MVGNFAIGEVIRPTKHDVQTLKLAAELITQGDWVEPGASGNLTSLADTDTIESGVYMALETVDNSAGAAGAKEMQVAGAGSYVTALMGVGVRPGALVKLAASDDRLVEAAVADIAGGKVIGRYKKLAGGESVVTVDGDVGVILIGAS